MKVTIDPDICQGNGVCERRAPGVFALQGDLGVVVDPHPPAERRAEVEAASRGCPTQAILIEDASPQ